MKHQKKMNSEDQDSEPAFVSNKKLPAGGKILYIAGQLGWDENQIFPSKELVPQFDLALKNVLSVLQAAGGGPDDLCRITCYCKDRTAYLEGRDAIKKSWERQMAGSSPPLNIVFVVDLLGKFSLIEIEGTAILSSARPSKN